MIDIKTAPEVQNRLSLLYSAADKENLNKTFSVKLEGGVYTPFNTLADRVADNILNVPTDTPDGGREACNTILEMAKVRRMTVAEFVTLSAGVSDKFIGDRVADNPMDKLDPKALNTIDNLLGRSIALSPDLLDQIMNSAEFFGIPVREYLRAYGRRQIEIISKAYEGGLPKLREDLLKDMEGEQMPSLFKAQRELDRRLERMGEELTRDKAKLEAERDARLAESRKPTDSGVKQAAGEYIEAQRIKTVIDLAQSLKVDFNSLPEPVRLRLLAIKDTTALYIELSNLGLNAQQRTQIGGLSDLERIRDEKLAELDRERKKLDEEAEARRNAFEQRERDDREKIEKMRRDGMSALRDNLADDLSRIDSDHQKRLALIQIDHKIHSDTLDIYRRLEEGRFERREELMLRTALEYMDETFHLTISDALRVSGGKTISQKLVKDRPDLFPNEDIALDFVISEDLAKKSLAGDRRDINDPRLVQNRRNVLKNAARNIEHVIETWVRSRSGRV